MNQSNSPMNLPLLGITAYSGTGKTTLLKQVIPLLRLQQIRVGLIKHTHHNMDVDKPGKDSYELRKSGAAQTLVASQQRWALMTETPELPELDLHYLASRFDAASLDLILVEGFKNEAIAKIALYRDGLNHTFEELIDPYVIAVASDIPLDTPLPQLDINRPEQVAEFIVKWLLLTPPTTFPLAHSQ
ncbi:molybdopterin-guanine dinucleotide biosynthesis protein B [Xenorhabdus sp. PB61.4]|uniref:molybdopterin-guanine dinucleotide biosynthesis protein MobB n=1 Tax=Xenorhabdus sp. PB61.4 TaxID=2788940 RepID=UPI001E4B4D49|nr:molybdopterin-guanine dinucleotide biosynthesis protein MobB [Xenorhabdus sp. PB61.4]MCC8367263.1 molybdopterin-guanine dinucleotide biosynthesis protein B [Xenorhabdus sp. PB61.4]